MKRCPHADIRFCPLYHAAHEAGGLGCDDGHLDCFKPCGVARKVNYERNVERLRVTRPGLVERLAFAEDAEQAKAQRKRNLKAAGLN